MDNYNDVEFKRIIFEIVLVIVLFFISIPICVKAADNYNAKKEAVLDNCNVSVDINNVNYRKYVTIENFGKEEAMINLVLRISKFSNEYMLELGEEKYYLNKLDFEEDEEYYYYNIKDYKIDDKMDVDFKLVLTLDNGYDDNIRYSFLAEVANC